jgi:hypothetical protein
VLFAWPIVDGCIHRLSFWMVTAGDAGEPGVYTAARKRLRNTWAQESTTTVNGGEKEWASSRYIPEVPHPLPSSLPPPHEDHSTR